MAIANLGPDARFLVECEGVSHDDWQRLLDLCGSDANDRIEAVDEALRIIDELLNINDCGVAGDGRASGLAAGYDTVQIAMPAALTWAMSRVDARPYGPWTVVDARLLVRVFWDAYDDLVGVPGVDSIDEDRGDFDEELEVGSFDDVRSRDEDEAIEAELIGMVDVADWDVLLAMAEGGVGSRLMAIFVSHILNERAMKAMNYSFKEGRWIDVAKDVASDFGFPLPEHLE